MNRVPRWLRPGLLYVGVPLAAVVLSTGVVLADWSADVTDAFKPGPISAAKVQKLLATLRSDVDAGPKFIGFSGTIGGFNLPANKATRIEGYAQNFSSPEGAFNTAAGSFKVPQDGYYRFTTGGFATASADSADTRIGFFFYLDDDSTDGTLLGNGGAQLSASDTPLPSSSQSVKLKAGQTVFLKVFCPKAITLGGGFRFEGEFLGR